MPTTYLNAIRPELLIWKHGRPAQLWMRYERRIGKIIEANNLKPVNLRSMGINKDTISASRMNIEFIQGIDGGRRVPHFHYKGELYMVSSAQWRDFSERVVKDMTKRLADAKQVNLTELLDVTEAVGNVLR